MIDKIDFVVIIGRFKSRFAARSCDFEHGSNGLGLELELELDSDSDSSL